MYIKFTSLHEEQSQDLTSPIANLLTIQALQDTNKKQDLDETKRCEWLRESRTARLPISVGIDPNIESLLKKEVAKVKR